ncbi:hypothetical protein BJF87_20640 [Gordonia sp. CNJ-863]|uniref:hypothetical protein n=1 Tax=Gordonia TaxID=2053 RepID=UPI000967F187|nr:MULTISPECIES: hypothetical protein [Gordonia]MDH3022581.1 hypothetical protein [Gordonia alkanivorans]MDJ0007454.1 hypothetical protein [Gordonia alkanivorans]MDJ0099662.1 hypothetical protein [Gordonia alkanivorans]MDJ0492796.1 hypothetical protein [Gordonia alkanivorans]OLT48337.1 hypothetical protein BJF87_20640 [Gordonia sp. CNJ-863]
MSKNPTTVPVWTIATDRADVPAVIGENALTPERLDSLRTALAALSDIPLTTLEAHDVPKALDRSKGIHLHGVSPLATQLSELVKKTPNVVPDGGETLYKMVVPPKFASQFASGIVKPMASSNTTNGIHSALSDGSKIAAQASFVPVSAGKAAAAGAATGSATTAGAAVAGAGALTLAAPLVLMAVAVGVSAYADHQRQKTMERITELLEKLIADNLEAEQHSLEACRGAIVKATSVLLDEGRIGASLGLDSTVFAIEEALSRAKSRIAKWEKELSNLSGDKVELTQLAKLIPTIEKADGEFYVHVELAQLAIAMKQRVMILQAVEHAQLSEGNPFERFVATLQAEKRDVDSLEQRLEAVILRLSALQLDRSHGIRDVVFSSGEVDKLLETTRRLRDLGQSVQLSARQSEVTIEILQEKDGSVVVFPAIAS